MKERGEIMRIDRKKLVVAMLDCNLNQKQLAELAGISRMTVNGVKNGRSCSQHTGEWSIGSVTENTIEWITGQQTATLTLARGSLATRVKKLAEQRSEECQIIAQNKDGSILARVPVKWLKVNPTMHLSEEQRKARIKNLKKPET